MVWTRKMMLLLLLFPMLLLQSFKSSAQTWNEFFKQKKTQVKYLGQQIAALELYIGYARKGYEIIDGGINVVKEMSSGEFSLHRNFFASLAAVNPVIKNSVRVLEITDRQISILALLEHWKSDELTRQEQINLDLVKANLLGECLLDMEALFLIMSSGKLELTDDQRLQRLEKIWLSMQDKYAFAVSFSRGITKLLNDRKTEAEDIAALRNMYLLNP